MIAYLLFKHNIESDSKEYSGSQELSGEEDKDNIFEIINSNKPINLEEVEEDQFTEDILPPIPIDWKTIINDYIRDLGY